MIRGLIHYLLLLAAITQLASCTADYDLMAKERLEFARKQRGEIEVTVIKHHTDPSYLRGVLLAAKEINQRPGRLIGRHLHIHAEEEHDTVEDSMPAIRRIAANPKTVAVLGHRKSSIAIPASVIYERSQIIFLPSFATADSLTGHKFQYTFRMMPNTKNLAAQQANLATSLGYKTLVILYARDPVSRELAFLFEDAALAQGIKVIKRASFFGGSGRNYRPVISQFNSEPFDAVYIAAGAEGGGQMARQLREMGLSQPIIGSDALGRTEYKQIAGENASDHTIVPSIYKFDIDSGIGMEFARKYKREYGELPNQRSAQGYDSMNLLANAISHAKSTLGPTLSSTLRYMPAWVGVTGIHAFDQDGELRGKKYFFQVWQQGGLIDLPAIHHFYLLDRFTQSIKEQYGENYPVTDFSEIFKKRMHEDDHKIYLLDLAHEIIRFKRIGIIYENTDSGRAKANYNLLKTLAKRKDIKLVECQVPFSLLEEKEAEKELLSCYGRLSLNMDALLVPDYYQSVNNPNLIKQLDSALGSYKIPSISVNSRGNTGNASISLTKRTDIKLNPENGSAGMQAYNGLLKGLKIHQFYDQLTGLPEIRVNLVDLQHDDLPDKPILDISTDAYLHSNTVIKEHP